MGASDKHQATLARVHALEAEVADLERRLPAHSIPASLLLKLEDLEEQLAAARARLASLDAVR